MSKIHHHEYRLRTLMSIIVMQKQHFSPGALIPITCF